MIVDDSVDNQELLTTLFESMNYKVDHVSNGAEALTLLLSCSVLPDLILLDYQMPVMNGFQFRKLQLENKLIQNIPLIVMTGDVNNDLVVQMSHPFRIIIKPLQIQNLIETVFQAVH